MSESENKLIVDKIKQLEIENKELRACHESELGVCFQHCEEVKQLQAELDKHRWIPVSERLPKEKGIVLAINIKFNLQNVLDFSGSPGQAKHIQRQYTHWKPIILPKP